jgi:hypothetical protein
VRVNFSMISMHAHVGNINFMFIDLYVSQQPMARKFAGTVYMHGVIY